MKIPVCVAIFVACLLSPGVSAQRPERSVSDVVKATVDSVVLIVVSDESGKQVAEGSGFITSSDGKIVTNHHVIAGAHSAVVKLNNGAFFVVDGILADDPRRDIAVIKVSGKNLPSLAFADSDRLSAGDHVVAIGSPLGLENSISDGIISGFREDSKGRSWVQTTAPVSHGNSGGPLLTMDEQVAGVVTWKAAAGENLNFAVPGKLVVALLSNSSLQPLGSTVQADSVSSATPAASAAGIGEKVWASLVSGRDFKVRIDGDSIYTEWVNLPSTLQSTGAFMRAELKKSGDKWIGKSRSSLPFNYYATVTWCRIETDIEIDTISESRIEGRGFDYKVNVRKCQPEKQHWVPFTWIPK